jgi:hypothetical protein
MLMGFELAIHISLAKRSEVRESWPGGNFEVEGVPRIILSSS